MTSHRYTIILEREEDGGFHAFVPALRGCHTQGDDEQEALANAEEAIAAYLESLKAHGEPIPGEAVPDEDSPRLTDDIVRATIERTRR